MSLTVYGFGRSRSQRALWALEEAGLDYDYRRLDARAGEHQSPEYRAINPGGKVPALKHDDFIVTESAVICTYIADQVPDRHLAPPAGTPERYHYDQWLFFAVTELEQPLWTQGKHRFVLPRALRVPQILEVVPKEFARAEAVFAQGLGDRPFIMGDGFTMADVLLGHTLFWAMASKVPVEQPNLRAYATRLAARPAWKRALARDAA